MTRPVRVVQVGLGLWGSNWAADVLPEVETVEAVGYVDSSPAALRQVQKAIGVPRRRCFTDLASALEAVEAELELATASVDAHFAVARAALEAGRHVLVEKPFTATLAEAAELAALSEATGRRCDVSQNYRFQPAPILAARLLARGRIGRVHQVTVDFRRNAMNEGIVRDWVRKEPLLLDMAIHHFDLMRMVLADEPVRVSCRSWNPGQSRYTEPAAAVATIDFAGGTVVSWRGSFVSEGEPTPWAGCWRIEGSEGELRFSSRDHLGSRVRPDRLSLRRGGRSVRVPAQPVLAHLDREGALAATAQAILSGSAGALVSDARHNARSLALAHAAIASAGAGGAWTDIERAP